MADPESVPSGTGLTFEEWLQHSQYATLDGDDFGVTVAEDAFNARQPEIDACHDREWKLREAISAVTLAGGMMANMCFNGKQADMVPANYRKAMADCQELWDGAAHRLAELLAAKEGCTNA